MKGTIFKVIDNTGVTEVLCLKYTKKYKGILGNEVIGVIKKLNNKTNLFKYKIVKGIIVLSNILYKNKLNFYSIFIKNSIILIDNYYNLIGTRIKSYISVNLLYYKYLKLFSLAYIYI